MSPSIDQNSPLKTHHGYQHIKGYGCKTVFFQESHQKSETNKDHHMDILEHWNEITNFFDKYNYLHEMHRKKCNYKLAMAV